MNLVIWDSVFERYSVVAKTAAFLGITGTLQGSPIISGFVYLFINGDDPGTTDDDDADHVSGYAILETSSGILVANILGLVEEDDPDNSEGGGRHLTGYLAGTNEFVEGYRSAGDLIDDHAWAQIRGIYDPGVTFPAPALTATFLGGTEQCFRIAEIG